MLLHVAPRQVDARSGRPVLWSPVMVVFLRHPLHGAQVPVPELELEELLEVLRVRPAAITLPDQTEPTYFRRL